MDRRPRQQIVAFGGGGFSMEPNNPLLDDYVLSLVGSDRPKVCFIPTASGDADHYVVRFYRTFCESDCESSHVSLFRRNHGVRDIEEHLLSRDVIYVGGGSVLSLLGAWQAHGLDKIIRKAWEAGAILCGGSAGSLCWFASGVTAFHGAPQRYEGLGLLPWSNCVHYDAEPERDGAYRSMLLDGMPQGYAAEDGTALHFTGARLSRVVSSRPAARAYRMRAVGGKVERRMLMPDYLGAGEPVAAAA